MSSASSAITYTSVYTDSEPGRVFWGADEELSDKDYIPGPEEPQTPPVLQDEDEREPMFIQPHDPDYVPGPMYPEYIPLEDEHVFLAEEQPLPPVVSPTAESPDDGDDDDGDSSGDDADDEDDDAEEEEEDHLALADSTIVLPASELVTPPEETEPASISLPPEVEVERLLAMPNLPPSLLTSLSPPSVGEHLARLASAQALIDEVTAILPSPPLLPLPPPLYIPPPVVRRDDILETEMPPRKRSYLFALGSVYEIRKSFTARPTEGTEGVVSLTWWLKKMEWVFQISGCAIENQEVLKNKMTDKYCPQGEIKKLEIKLWNLKVKGNDVPTYTERFQELTLICTKFVVNETEKIDKYISGLPDNIFGSVNFSKPKTLDETIELANDFMDQKLRTYVERHTNNKRKADDLSRNNHGHQQQPVKRQNVAKLKNKDEGNVNAQGWVYVVGNAEKKGNASRDPKSNVVTGNNYDVELADGKLVRIDTIIRGFTLNFLNHPFNIDLMSVELGSFDIIIGMDWLKRYHAMIVCDEKLVQIPYENETLNFRGDKSNDKRESRLTIISCSKAQKYMAKGCQIFLAQISAKKEGEKLEGKQLKDIPIV
nr:reverse transcriptase domain-containing protein [Tanacetum cinerariifolium]